MLGLCGMDSSGLGQRPVAGFCEERDAVRFEFSAVVNVNVILPLDVTYCIIR
jgi:hypothetical protein